MSDTKCIVCGEPWDAYGVRHGDMLEWEADLFRKGAGCPRCEGTPTKPFGPNTIFDFDNGDEDPMDRIVAYENQTERPIWKRPEPEIVWACVACGVQVVINPDVSTSHEDRLEWNLSHDAPATKWWRSHKFDSIRPTEEPAYVFDQSSNDPKPVCEFCLDRCEHCGAPISKTLDRDDVYDEGWCGTPEGYAPNLFCVNCIENEFCSDCGLLRDDCECDIDTYE